MLDRGAIGKRYPEQAVDVTADGLRAFAHATNEDNPRFLGAGPLQDVVAPPLFAIVAAAPSERLALDDESLTGPGELFRRQMVRGDNEIVWSDVIRPGDRIASQAVVTAIEEKVNGELLRLGITLRRGGREVARVSSGYFVRGATSVPKSPPPSEPRGPILAAVEMAVTADQARRYADASGDRNPIHLDDVVARTAGHPGVILQGSCTMAFVAKAVLDALCDGDPRRLKKLRVRYARPVLPGDLLTTILWRQRDVTQAVRHGLETKRQDGTIVVKNAWAEVAP